MSCKKCSSSPIDLNTSSIRSNTLFEIYCKFLTPHIKKAKQEELVNLTAATGAYFTIFKKCGPDYIRKRTTLMQQNGKYAINSVLDPLSLAYIALTDGKSYEGFAKLYEKTYYSWYWTIDKDYVGCFGTTL